jgi:hypothetical protein
MSPCFEGVLPRERSVTYLLPSLAAVGKQRN